MLEINGWFFVLMANFLVLAFVLNLILFQPLLRIFKEREKAIGGAMDEARELEVEREDRATLLKSELASGSREAKRRFEALRSEGLDKQREKVDAATKEAMAMIEKAKAELRTESDRARTTLRADVEKFADEVVGKLLKV